MSTGVSVTSSQKCVATANAMVANDKGLLAMDESTPTCNKRFEKAGIPQTEEARRSYRELILTTPGLGESISGVIVKAVVDALVRIQPPGVQRRCP